jgi:hypothetical protein
MSAGRGEQTQPILNITLCLYGYSYRTIAIASIAIML